MKIVRILLIRRRLDEYGLFEILQEKASSLKRTRQHGLGLHLLHLNKPQDFWKNVLWTVETEVKMFEHNAQCHVWEKPNTECQQIYLIPTVNHSGGVIILACFGATGHGHLAVIRATMHSSV